MNPCLGEVSTGSGSDLVLLNSLRRWDDQVAIAPCTDPILPKLLYLGVILNQALTFIAHGPSLIAVTPYN